MREVHFLSSNGDPLSTVSDGASGEGASGASDAGSGASVAGDLSLLEVAQAAGLPLEGTCEGQMACSTCHVIIVDGAVFDALPRATEAEDDMLDLAAGACRTSRLSCQLRMADLPDGLIVRLPGDVHDMQGV